MRMSWLSTVTLMEDCATETETTCHSSLVKIGPTKVSMLKATPLTMRCSAAWPVVTSNQKRIMFTRSSARKKTPARSFVRTVAERVKLPWKL